MSQFRESCFSYAVAVAKSLLNVHGSDIVVVDKCQFASVEAYETEREREREIVLVDKCFLVLKHTKQERAELNQRLSMHYIDTIKKQKCICNSWSNWAGRQLIWFPIAHRIYRSLRQALQEGGLPAADGDVDVFLNAEPKIPVI